MSADAVGVLRQSLAGREQQEEGENTADNDHTAGQGSSCLVVGGGGRKRRREEDEEDEREGEVEREEVRPSRSQRPTAGSSIGSPHPPPTSSQRSGPRPRPESGWSWQYTRQEGGMTELSWVPSNCRYADAVAREKHGEQIGQSCEETPKAPSIDWNGYSTRLRVLNCRRPRWTPIETKAHEIILANPESHLH